MHRRAFLTGGSLALAALPFAGQALAQTQDKSQALTQIRTRWVVTSSDGFDAIAFLGPLSGKPIHVSRYKDELAAFQPRYPAAAKAALDRAQVNADAVGKLLWPTVANFLSYGPTDSIEDLLTSLEAPETRVLPAFRASSHWDEKVWAFINANRQDLRAALAGLRDADFVGFRRGLVAEKLKTRPDELKAALTKYDVIAEQERLIGRQLMPTITVVLLWFSKPMGVSAGVQRSLSHFDYASENVVRIVAHEMLHPPFPMDGPAAKAALAVLDKDPLMVRVLKEHNPDFGYNTMDGILNEDTVEALDQIVSERLGVARDPAERWSKADDGMHVLAAAIYGMLKAEGYDRTGGNIERWMEDAARTGKLSPERIRTFAGQVTKTPPDQLWPRPKAAA
jgi:hypothetical protein